MQVNLKTRAKSHGHGQADTDRRTRTGGHGQADTYTHSCGKDRQLCKKRDKVFKRIFFDYLKIIGI